MSSPERGSSSRMDVRVTGQGAAHLDETADPSGSAATGALATLVRLRSSSRPSTRSFSSREAGNEGAGIDHVAPEPAPLEAHAVRQNQVLAYGQTQEQLGLLEGAGQTAFGATRGGLRW